MYLLFLFQKQTKKKKKMSKNNIKQSLVPSLSIVRIMREGLVILTLALLEDPWTSRYYALDMQSISCFTWDPSYDEAILIEVKFVKASQYTYLFVQTGGFNTPWMITVSMRDESYIPTPSKGN